MNAFRLLLLFVASSPLAAGLALAADNVRSYPVDSCPRSVAIGDLNRDGLQDLVAANYCSNTLSLLLNHNGQTFEAAQALATAERPAQVAIADLNQDASPDLVVACQAVSVFLGNGDGSFQSRVDYQSWASCLAVGDADGDGLLDVVAGQGTDHIMIFPGNGDGTLGTPTTMNANPDMVVPSPVLESRQTMVTERSQDSNGPMKFAFVRGVAIGDMDRDGWPDIAVGLDNYYEGSVEVLLGNGDGTFRFGPWIHGTLTSWSVVARDFTGDGWLDLALASERWISLIVNHGDGTFASPQQLQSEGNALGLAAADVNRDGRLDLVSSNYRDQAWVWLGTDKGFELPGHYQTGIAPWAVAIGDLNGDGWDDLATANDSSNTVSVLLGDGRGNFGIEPFVGVPAGSIASGLLLARVHPNPVSTVTTIEITLPLSGRASLRVFDAAGRSVATLLDGQVPAGAHSVQWDRRGLDGAIVSSGVYYCELRFDGESRVQRMVVLR